MLDWRISATVVFINVALGSFVYKRAQQMGIRPGSYMVVQTFCFFSAMGLAGLVTGSLDFSSPYLGLGVLAGMLGITGSFSSLRSMYRGELGTNIAVTRLSFVPTAFGGIILFNESVTLRKALLLVFAAIAVFLFFDHYRRDNQRALRSLGSALVACFAFGLFDLVYKYASMKGVNSLAFLLIQSGTAHLLINIYVMTREKYAITRTILRTAPLSGILFSTACLAWLNTLRQVEVSLITPLVQLNFILTYLLGVVFFQESITRRKLFGIAVVAMSIFLLSEEVVDFLNRLWEAIV